MKWLLLTLALLPLCACTKSENPMVSFAVNGRPCNYSGIPGNFSHVGYVSGERLSYDFYFMGAFGDFFGAYVPGGAGFESVDGQFTDSLYIGVTYAGSYSQSLYKFFGVFVLTNVANRFYVTITRNNGNTWDGTFSGYVEGINVIDGSKERDTISNGVFKNLPINRTFK